MKQKRQEFKWWTSTLMTASLTMFSAAAGVTAYANASNGHVGRPDSAIYVSAVQSTGVSTSADSSFDGSVAQPENIAVAAADIASSAPPDATDIASQAQIISLQVTGTPDQVFAQQETKYLPVGNSMSEPGKWARFLRQGGREITFSLGGLRNVSSMSLSFEQNSKSGIYWPTSMEVQVSIDGLTWYVLNDNDLDATVQGDVKTFTLTPSSPVQASLIKIVFPVRVWVFAGQLHIWSVNQTGVHPAQVGTPLVPRNSSSSTGLLTSTRLNGARHILLVYTGDHGQLGKWSAQDFLPMLEYIDPNGRAESQMFDTMLFLPYSNAGGTATGWSKYLDDLFGPDGEFAHLNAAAEQAGRQVFSARTVNVIFTIPYPDSSQRNFGAVSDGGPKLNFSVADVGDEQSLQNRKTAIRWYYDEFMTRWKEAGYPHLRLIGVYWYKETDPSSDVPLIQYVRELASKDNLLLLWIPAYGTSISDWQSMGFDGVILQSNYYETTNATLQRVENAVQTAEQNGLGLEIELDGGVFTNTDLATRYRSELQSFASVLPPSSDAVLVFYAASKVLLQAYESPNTAQRSIYDETGSWLMAH
ncbi:hypothetical protein GCM10010885_24500 [Alicyclobacillus cellulosilyticus]|uniref:F5/8 type C domain-containing protein n=1 Tax=Alicyclobacillus cellulosilyticus TaxID=1003997 RepID=A0A917NNV9_9BACL|nr:DUF4855 domain-containing protein [Alicyclobacillus cellulosilyticus]GGJ14304.1 hypothetical protein GCM10010885_24500 [Alicyclobacillus cellulosilyticus]